MVWTRGDNLIHGLTQLGLLIDSLFDFKEEEVDSSVFCTYTYARAYQSLSLYVYVKKILSRRRKESEENKKKSFLSSEWEGGKNTHQLLVKSTQTNHRVVIHHDKRLDHLPSVFFLSLSPRYYFSVCKFLMLQFNFPRPKKKMMLSSSSFFCSSFCECRHPSRDETGERRKSLSLFFFSAIRASSLSFFSLSRDRDKKRQR